MSDPTASAPVSPIEPYRQFFGLPVALQLAHPYVAIPPFQDEHGPVVQAVKGPNGEEQIVGLPSMPTINGQTGAGMLQVLLGVLRPSACGTRLIVEMSLARPRALIDVLLRPEQIAVVTLIREVESRRLIVPDPNG